MPARPTDEQIETARLFVQQHRPDYKRQCPTLTCAVGAYAVPWPCKRWIWAEDVLRQAGIPIDDMPVAVSA
ncbi:hypothetical protein [Cryptosporangium sp. NPDC051539]|uniref:hypothetical protein n=1 Tax=Cryptosporangium sp. NPDC051539 TaxID=3363962 RepID=UPI003789869F